MLEFFRQLWAGTGEAWARLSLSARVNIFLALVITVGVLVGVVFLGVQPQYVALYRGLDPGEVAQMQQVLADRSIPYQLADGGTTIRVPDRQAGEARTVLSAERLPSHHGLGAGWELLDNDSIWTSPEQRRVNQQRAIEGELRRMLSELDFVNRSFVGIRWGEQRLLARDRRPATATITLDVNRRPTATEVETVVAIVSTFVGADLDRSHITVATTDSQLLHGPTEEGAVGAASSKHALIAKWERLREDKIRDAFAELGRKAIVKVSAKVDFTSKEVTEERVEEGAELSVMETSTELTSTEALPEGPAGAYANLPEGAGGPGATRTTEITEETLTNFEPSRILTKTVTEPGDVLKYKVSAIIDWGHKPVLDEEGKTTGEQTYGPMDEQEKENWKQFIANAVGPEVALADVHVTDQPFQLDQLREAPETFVGERRGTMVSAALEWLATLGKIALVLLGLWWVRRGLVKMMVPRGKVEEVLPVEVPGASPEELRKRQLASDVERFSEQQPQAVAALLRSWMSESEE